MSRDTMRKCSNCKERLSRSWSGEIEYCPTYEAISAEDEAEYAKDCPYYEYDNPSYTDEDDYCPSATRGDYSPSCPWNAPGMSIKDFI